MKLTFNELSNTWMVSGLGKYSTKWEALEAMRANKKDRVVSVRISQKTYDALREMGAEDGKSVGRVMRDVIEQEVG